MAGGDGCGPGGEHKHKESDIPRLPPTAQCLEPEETTTTRLQEISYFLLINCLNISRLTLNFPNS